LLASGLLVSDVATIDDSESALVATVLKMVSIFPTAADAVACVRFST
jgi:hypothetical protein